MEDTRSECLGRDRQRERDNISATVIVLTYVLNSVLVRLPSSTKELLKDEQRKRLVRIMSSHLSIQFGDSCTANESFECFGNLSALHIVGISRLMDGHRGSKDRITGVTESIN